MSNISQFIKVNNNKIEIHKKGNKGIPIIILTGMGCSFYEWYDITESLSKLNRVIIFHRPGLGLSEIGAEDRNTKAVVNELNDIMLQLELSEPVILVGHSYGGLCAQHFAKVHPEQVAGIVLVDSTSVNLKELDDLDLPVLDEGDTDKIWMEKCYSYSLMKQEELKEKINPAITEKQKQLPLDIQQRLINFQTTPSLYKAMYSEISNWKKDADAIKDIGKFPDIPLIVIGRDKEYNVEMGIMDGLPKCELRLLEEKWQELIEKQANLSNNSELIYAEESSHSIYADRPDIIIESINRIVKKIHK